MFDEELEARHEEITKINKLIHLLNDFVSGKNIVSTLKRRNDIY
jgi:hypothetical protein